MGKQSYLSGADRMSLGILLGSNDYGWTTPNTTRVYILSNPEDAVRFDLMSYIATFRGSGHSEWEGLWAMCILESAGKSVETGEPCDISALFNRDYLARNDRKFTAEQTWNHLKRFFTVVSETEDKVVLRLNT